MPPRGNGPSGPKEKKPGKGDLIIRCVVLAVLLAAMAAFGVTLARTKMLSGKYMILVVVLLAVLFAIVAVLMLLFGKQRKPWGAIALSAVLTVVMVLGTVMGAQGISALRSITSPTYTVSHIGIYVQDSDPGQSLDDIAGYTFGIMDTLGRESVDKAIEDINSRVSTPIQTAEFSGPALLVNALFDGSVNAAIMDTSYIDGLRELDEYKDVVGQMREITDMHVKLAVVPTPSPEPVVQEEQAEEENAESEGHVFTALISGIDSRNGLVKSSLSDVNIIVTLNEDTHQVSMVSTPRDFFVPFSNTGTRDKLTHTGWYGVEVTMDTLADLYDVDIDYYFRVNFEGFVNIIDALGGVTVDSEKAFTSQDGYSYNQGPNTLNGKQALSFARERKAFVDGDRQRGRDQMAVIRAVIKKALSPDLLARYSSLLGAVEGSFETTLPYDLIASMIRNQLDNGGDWNIVSYSVTGSDSYQVSPLLGMNVYVMVPDESTVETAKNLMAQVRAGETVTAPQ